MKLKYTAKSVLFSLIAVGASAVLNAQTGVQIVGLGGYVFGDKFSVDYGEGRIDGGGNYGGMINFFPNDNIGFGVMYTINPTFAEVRSTLIPGDQLPGSRYDVRFDANIHYITAGFIRRHMVGNGSVNGALMLGAAIGEVADDRYPSASETLFATGLHLWYDHNLSDKVGLKFMTSLQVPIRDFGAGFSIGTGGVNVGAGGYSDILQFGFVGGLNFNLGN